MALGVLPVHLVRSDNLNGLGNRIDNRIGEELSAAIDTAFRHRLMNVGLGEIAIAYLGHKLEFEWGGNPGRVKFSHSLPRRVGSLPYLNQPRHGLVCRDIDEPPPR